MNLRPSVVVVDDHALVGHGLVLMLAAEGVQASTVTGAELRAWLNSPSGAHGVADLVVLDLELDEGIDGADFVPTLTERGTTVVVCTGETDPGRRGRCLELGALAVLPKSRPTHVLLAAVLAALDGDDPMPAAEHKELVAAARAQRADEERRLSPFSTLTNREAEVLSGLMAGLAPAVIAAGSGVSVKTVRNQIESVLMKLGVRTQLQAVNLAAASGWQPPAILAEL